MVTKIAVILLSILLLIIVYLTTQNLYNYRVGLIITAITALDMQLILSTKMGYSENMVVLFFILTIWSLLKGIKQNDRYIILAGLFAGLTLISKTAITPLFILIGLIGFIIWRFIYMQWDLFKNKNYLISLIIFLIIISIRYILMLNTVQGGFPKELILHSFDFIQILPFKLFWILLLISIYSIFWIPELKNTLTKVKDEYYSCIWLIIISFTLMTILITSIIPLIEDYDWHYSIFREDNLRYVVLLYVPLMWLAIGDINFNFKRKKSIKDYIIALIDDKKNFIIIIISVISSAFIFIKINDIVAIFWLFGSISLIMKDPRKKLAIMLTIFLIISTNAVSGSVRTEIIDSVEGLNKLIQDGDIVALDQVDNLNLKAHPHNLYPYMANHNITFILYNENCNAIYILSQKNISYNGYELIETFQYKWKPTFLRKIAIYTGSKHQGPKRPPMKLWKIKHQ